jgi:hypothetical protein
MGPGSQNLIITGTGANRIFKGITVKNSVTGSKTLMNVGDGYGGLGRYDDSTALGSVFRVLGAIFYIGAGKLFYNGTATGDTASSTLSLRKVVSGALSGSAYQAGLAQPSAPTISAITPPTGYTGKNDGTVSVKIARVRSATGARSIASPVSNTVQCKNQSVLVTFPSADANGQDYWEIDVTLNGYGGIGNHYFLQELAETSVVGTTIAATATGVSSTTISVPNSTLTSSNVGWTIEGTKQWEYITCAGSVTATGNAKTVVTAAGMTGSPKTITFSVTNGDSATTVATNLYTALNGDAAVTAVFDVYRDGVTVYLKKKTGTDSTMNFTLQNDTSTGITEVTSSSGGVINTWVTAVGAADSASAGNQLITLNSAIGLAATYTDSVTFTQAVSGVKRSYAFEWYDADLSGADLAPNRDYPPPAGIFGGVSGDVVFVDGALGDTVNTVTNSANTTPTTAGNAIAVSDPARPESFPPDNYLFTNDSPVALIEGTQGLYWRFGSNSLGVIRYVGGAPALSFERLWTGIGIKNQKNVTLGGGGRLYAYTGTRGAIRLGTGGEPDTFFAARVADDMASWTPANVVLGYDANYQYVLFGHNQTLLVYFEPMDIWCAPLDLSATLGAKTIKAMVTYNSEVYIAAGDNSVINLYTFDAGSGTLGKFVTQWQETSAESDVLSRIRIALRADASSTLTVKTYTNGSDTAFSTQSIDINSGLQIPTTFRPNARNARIWKISGEMTSTGGTSPVSGWENMTVDGESSGITL